jgi:glucuronokinase
MGEVVRRVAARVGLVGNPSDGYSGAVLATVVPAIGATIAVDASDEVRFEGPAGVEQWRSVADWRRAVDAHGHDEAQRIIGAALQVVADHLPDEVGGVSIRWSTEVPRSVGLAGSSALAVGVIDAVASCWGVALDRRVLAALALRAERDVLGIAAGWQDRIVQSFGHTVLVDAAHTDEVDRVMVPRVGAPSGGPDATLVVGWHAGGADSSGVYHGALRRSAAALVAPMAELAALARSAAEAWDRGDAHTVAGAMRDGWRVRQACAPLRPDHASLVDSVASTGVGATTPGSGGSVVALCLDAAEVAAAEAALDAVGADRLRWPCRG